MRQGKVAQWRVYEDTIENRRVLWAAATLMTAKSSNERKGLPRLEVASECHD